MAESVGEVAQRLIERIPFWATPDGAFDQCWMASHFLVNELRGRGIDAEVVPLVNFKQEPTLPQGALPDIWRQLPQTGWCHFVVRTGEAFIDLTARQFEPHAACPLIMTEAELEARWDLKEAT